MRLAPFVALLGARTVLGWGVVGHEIVATIAQIHLHPSARAALQQLLPTSQGHLAPIAAWADRIRGIPALRWTGELHYTSPLLDHPPNACHFGDAGFKTDHDVLHAISNFTQKLIDNPADGLAIRLLTHFVADAHQPLHLTDRERGGNGDYVLWERRKMSLHALWDGGLITKIVREQRNYTRPLPSAQIERDLRGTIYDPYIRLILWEGVRTWWRSDLPAWLSCPPMTPTLSQRVGQFFFAPPATLKNGRALNEVVCPLSWAQETHKVTCENVYPVGFELGQPAEEVCTEAYWGPIRDGNVVDKLLAQGGLRLAATLNAIFATEEEISTGSLNWGGWMEEADRL